jgi:hypothetical protein
MSGTVFEPMDDESPATAVDRSAHPWVIPLTVGGRRKFELKQECVVEKSPKASQQITLFTGTEKGWFTSKKILTISGVRAIDFDPDERPINQFASAQAFPIRQTGPQRPAIDELSVWVLPDYKLTTTFHLIKQPRQGSITQRVWDWCQELVNGVNKIITPQCNVSFELAAVKLLELNAADFEFLDGGSFKPPFSRYLQHLPAPLRLYYRGDSSCVNGKAPQPLGIGPGCDINDPALSKIANPVQERFIRAVNFQSWLRHQRNDSVIDVCVFDEFDFEFAPESKNVGAYTWSDVAKVVIPHHIEAQALAHEFGHWLFHESKDHVNGHHPSDGNLMYRVAGTERWRLTRFQIAKGQHRARTTLAVTSLQWSFR